MKIIRHVVLYNIINAEKKSMLTKWSHCDDQVTVQSIRHRRPMIGLSHSTVHGALERIMTCGKLSLSSL